MLLEKKFFLFLDLIKIKLELMLNNFVEKKETFFDYKKKPFQIPKNCLFPKGLTHAFGKKMQWFSLFVFAQKGLEIRFNNIMNRKKTFLNYKNKNFTTFQKWHFFWSKNAIFFITFFSLKRRLKVRANNVLRRKTTFFDYKNKIFHSLKNGIFPKGLTHDFGRKMPLFFFICVRSNKTRNSTYRLCR